MLYILYEVYRYINFHILFIKCWISNPVQSSLKIHGTLLDEVWENSSDILQLGGQNFFKKLLQSRRYNFIKQ